MSEREELAKLLYDMFPATYKMANFADCQGKFCTYAARLLPYIQQRVDTAVRAERERCARIADECSPAADVAAAIRSGEKL